MQRCAGIALVVLVCILAGCAGGGGTFVNENYAFEMPIDTLRVAVAPVHADYGEEIDDLMLNFFGAFGQPYKLVAPQWIIRTGGSDPAVQALFDRVLTFIYNDAGADRRLNLARYLSDVEVASLRTVTDNADILVVPKVTVKQVESETSYYTLVHVYDMRTGDLIYMREHRKTMQMCCQGGWDLATIGAAGWIHHDFMKTFFGPYVAAH